MQTHKTPTNPWFVVTRRVDRPRVRLFCFHYAGGNANPYRPWPDAFPPDIEICAIQLPGRGTRFGEPTFRRMEPLLDALVPTLQPLLGTPFAFFGHSMGGLIAYALTRRLRRKGGRLPEHLFVAARAAPGIGDPPIHALPEPEFIRELGRYGGLPPEVLRERELMELFIPIIRADFEVFETWVAEPEEPLPVPIMALGGLSDLRASRERLEPWREHTTAGFSLQMFPGDHFFIQSAQRSVAAVVVRALEGVGLEQ